MSDRTPHWTAKQILLQNVTRDGSDTVSTMLASIAALAGSRQDAIRVIANAASALKITGEEVAHWQSARYEKDDHDWELAAENLAKRARRKFGH